VPFIRQAAADFIAQRDGIPVNRNHIILTDGASKGVQAVILALLRTPHDGFMIPIPQYPLYSATIALYGGQAVGYYLDEENNWQLNEKILTDSLEKAKAEGVNPVAIAVINPGNPTGAVLSRDNIVMIIDFARRSGLALMADEVYQENVYAKGAKFFSFAKTMHDLGEKEVPLFSFHSVSKGFLGECGHRGGYMEMRNVPQDVVAQFVKLQSISLCANVSGQMATYLMVSPPQPGDESYDLYVRERDGILSELKEKARILGEGLSKIPGMNVDVPQGALYAFVRFELPPEKSVNVNKMTPEEKQFYEAKRDSDYCLTLLEETGICVVPGSGFGQLPGTLHFRTTFLPPRDEMEELVTQIKKFHLNYVERLLG
jgi:aspartate/methionine/tyrosine aminotransferase